MSVGDASNLTYIFVPSAVDKLIDIFVALHDRTARITNKVEIKVFGRKDSSSFDSFSPMDLS